MKVARIPVGAYSITIDMLKPSPQKLCKSSPISLAFINLTFLKLCHYSDTKILGLKNHKTKIQVISGRFASSRFEVVDAGVNWHFINSATSNSRSGHGQQKIYGKGPTLNEYYISLFINKANIRTEIEIQYYKQKSR